MEKKTIVIVGAGVAGVSAAEALRENGFKGGIVLLSRENTMPYDRPPLSKEALTACSSSATFLLRDETFYEANNIDLRLGVSATSIDPHDHVLTLSNNTYLTYDKLLLATGSRARTLPLFPYASPGIHYLRTLNDAQRLKDDMEKLSQDANMVIVGAGIIGLEVAAAAATQGLTVTVIETGERPLGRSGSPFLAHFLAEKHTEHGVRILCNTHIINVEKCHSGYCLSLSNDTQILANLVVVGVGVCPELELSTLAGIDVTPAGIKVDAQGRTTITDIYAAGEVAFHHNIHYGTQRRDETWQHAASHGAHVAKAMIGAPDDYSTLGSYWTDQYDLNIQVIGNPLGTSEIVRGNPDTEGCLIFHLDDSTICGITAINSTRALRKLRRLVVNSASIPIKVLADPESDLQNY
ncbi:MAG: FAD-dependent oxidoreductase [Acetobacter orientalis]|uniref:NAD(P)/FAD-dependent oxidoreductase n=1 Tax=Acetobacter orientalis TaxID=146474 RepID=UPI0039EB0707